MRELLQILEIYDSLQHSPTKLALATVVKVKGSTYRRPGARMLMTDDGRTVGSISGGCLEGEVLEKAKLHVINGKAQLAVYDMVSDADVWGLNQGCNGIMHLLLEPVTHPQGAIQFRFLHHCLRGQRRGVMATVFRVEGEIKVELGARVMLSEDGTVTEDVREPFLTSALLEDCREVLRSGRSANKEYRLTHGSVEAFIEFLSPPLPLVIIGAGSDAMPVARLAKELGWHVTVVDHRPALATRERFPSADVLKVARPEDYPSELALSPGNAVVIMTHNFSHDLEILRHMLPTPLRYLGLLGPKQRTELLLRKLRESGSHPTEEQVARIHAPIGLDVGADSPEEIALSILAEIQAALSHRGGGFLKNHDGPIHP
ncbi:MAG: XdhC/CoxI family protein [Bacteroidota bacterium]